MMRVDGRLSMVLYRSGIFEVRRRRSVEVHQLADAPVRNRRQLGRQ